MMISLTPASGLWGLPKDWHEDEHGMCTGFLLRRDEAAQYAVHRHGAWAVEAAQLMVRARDTGWHRPSYIHFH